MCVLLWLVGGHLCSPVISGKSCVILLRGTLCWLCVHIPCRIWYLGRWRHVINSPRCTPFIDIYISYQCKSPLLCDTISVTYKGALRLCCWVVFFFLPDFLCWSAPARATALCDAFTSAVVHFILILPYDCLVYLHSCLNFIIKIHKK